MNRSCRLDNFKIFAEFPKLLEEIAILESKAEYLKQYIEHSPESIEIINDSVEEVIRNSNINVYTVPDFVEDIYLDSVEDIEYEVSIISLHEGIAKVAVSALSGVAVSYSYTDEENSYYDKEDQDYLWKTTIERRDTAKVSVDFVISLDVSARTKEIKEERYIEFEEYIDMPDSIDIDEDNLLDFEILLETDPVYDGNGFCSNCADNH